MLMHFLEVISSFRAHLPWWRYVFDFDLISPPDEMGLLLGPTLTPRRVRFVILIDSRPRTRRFDIDLISPPDEMGLLLGPTLAPRRVRFVILTCLRSQTS